MDLSGRHLVGRDFSNKDLSGISFLYSDLRYANFSNSLLRNTNFTGASLLGARLSSCNTSFSIGLTANKEEPVKLEESDGCYVAYKLVGSNSQGPFFGGLTYTAGGIISINDLNTDVDESCGAGINIASLAWCEAKKLDFKRRGVECKIIKLMIEKSEQIIVPRKFEGKMRCRRVNVVV